MLLPALVAAFAGGTALAVAAAGLAATLIAVAPDPVKPAPYTSFPCRNPSAGNGRHDRGNSARLIGRT